MAEGKQRARSNVSDEGKQRARKRSAASAIEQHFDIDKDTFELLGAKQWDENYHRDLHDWFNLTVLIPLNILNAMNWNWPMFGSVLAGRRSMIEFWHGRHFKQFYWATAAYFATDALWVTAVPVCVASPGVIQKHHIATLLYTLIPKQFPEYGWLMGAAMSVEINTWLIIARRVFNKKGVEAFTLKANTPKGPMEVKLISVAFYSTWVFIRLIIYPVLCVVIFKEYLKRCKKVKSPINVLTIAPILQLFFCSLNFKWSFDLLLSKTKAGKGPSKGL